MEDEFDRVYGEATRQPDGNIAVTIKLLGLDKVETHLHDYVSVKKLKLPGKVELVELFLSFFILID